MQILLLAGGFGTRLRPLTYFRPKPLLPVANKPILQWILDHLPKDVDRILLPLNYLREAIEAYLAEHPDDRVELIDEPTPLGTGGAIKNGARDVSEPFVVYNGDIVSSIDVSALAKESGAKKALAGISLWPVDEPWHFGVVQLNGDGRVKRFVEKPPRGTEPSNLINAGHYWLRPEILDRIPSGRMVSMEREIYEPMAKAGEPLFGHVIKGYWADCGRPETLLEANRLALAAAKKKKLEGRGAKVNPSAKFEGYTIGEGTKIGARARVARSVLLPEVEVGEGATVEDSVLGEGAVVEKGATVRGSVVADYAVLEEGRTFIGQRVGLRREHQEA